MKNLFSEVTDFKLATAIGCSVGALRNLSEQAEQLTECVGVANDVSLFPPLSARGEGMSAASRRHKLYLLLADLSIASASRTVVTAAKSVVTYRYTV